MPATTLRVEAPLERLRYLRELQKRAAKIKQGVARYYDDPVGFANDCINWGESDGLTFYQEESLGALPERKREAVRGPHGLGKSSEAAIAVLWFALTRDAAGVDWKVVTTAGSWHQLTQYTWPEIHKWSGKLRWDKVRDGRPFSRAHELQNLNLRLNHGAAFAAASANAALIEGAHADSLLFVYDEAKAIPAGTFDACEGAFSGAGEGGTEAFALALSTPGSPQGRFYDICKHKPGYEDWHPVHVTLDDAMAAGRITAEWADQRARQWGTESAIYQNRVLGEFYASDEDSVIPLAWAEAAVERWHTWVQAGRPDPGRPRTVGVDVARCFDDQTEILTDDGWKFFEDLKGTEQVLTLRGDSSEWGPITQVHKYEHDGHLNVYEARGASFAITDGHRLLMRSPAFTRNPNNKDWYLREFRDLPRFSFLRRCSGWSGSSPETITFSQSVPMHHGGSRDRDWTFAFGDFCELLGWFVSEGCVYRERRRNGRARITIAQNKGPKLERILALLHRMGFAVRQWSKTSGGDIAEVYCRPLADWMDEHCGRGAANKRIPELVKNAAAADIGRFLSAFAAGDGTPNASGGTTYYTSSRALADDLQEVLAKIGLCGKMTMTAPAGSTATIGGRAITRLRDTWSVIQYCRPQEIYLDKAKVQRQRYKGFAYCVSTPLQTIMVRRNGVVMWSGNSGQDRTVLALRNGPVITELRRSVREDTMKTTGRTKAILDADDSYTAVVDVIGIGAGVVDRLREQHAKVVAFNASRGSKAKDSTREFGFANRRSEAWWSLRQALDPSGDPDICLPDDEMLLGDLSAPQWTVTSGGRIQVESKDDIRKRLGRSTDDGDAVVQAFVPHLGEHVPNARKWAGAADLGNIGLTEDTQMRRRLRGAHGGLLGGKAETPADAPWDLDGFEPAEDGQREEHGHRGNVRAWR